MTPKPEIPKTKLTPEIILRRGFKKVNNSMYRYNDLTLQNTYTHYGNTFSEWLLSYKRAYKVCYAGKYLITIRYEYELELILFNFGQTE